MKTKHFKLIPLLLLMLSLVSCVPEEEVDPDGTDPRDKFVGSWLFMEAKSGAWYEKSTYTVKISRDPSNSAQVLLRNFANVGSYNAYGVVTNKRITVPSQDVTSGGFVVSGTGNMLSSSNMNWEFSYTTGGDQEFITASATKQ